MSKNISETHKSAKKRARKRFKSFSVLVDVALGKMDDSMALKLRALTGGSGCVEPMVASDMALRWFAAKSLKRIMLQHRKGRKKAARQYVMGTFADDVGNTSDRCPIVALKLIRDKAYRALKSVGLSAIVVIEVHPLMNYPGDGQGRLLMYHAHFIAWRDERIDPNITAAVIQASGAWSNALGADPVHIQEIGDTSVDLAKVAYYLLKPPHSAKNRMPDHKRPGKFLLMDTTSGYRPELAVRVVEGLSQTDFAETIFGVNEGARIRQDLRKAAVNWHRNRLKGGAVLDSSVDLWRMWLDWRAEVGSKNFLPYRFYGGGAMPQASKIGLPKQRRPRPASRTRRRLSPRQLRAARRRKPLIAE